MQGRFGWGSLCGVASSGVLRYKDFNIRIGESMNKEKTVHIEIPAREAKLLKEITGRKTYKDSVSFVVRKMISANAMQETERLALKK